MTESEKIETLIRYRLEQAREALSAAHLNFANNLHRSAVNRAYYAMFYAVLALLASRRSETSRHSGAISQFDQLFVKPGLMPKEVSRWLHDAFLNRQAADYGSELPMTTADVEGLLGRARDFVGAAQQRLENDPLRTIDEV